MVLDIPSDLQARIDAIAARSSLSPSEVIADALKNGRSLEWQERFLDKVAEGMQAAERGEFATSDDLDRVVNKCRPS
ncbi:transcriptional regulator [Roseomonas hellenica]|uniref:Transcriptional regulator n=2 Tax=Plastoroseomonas hellenica TaxID=2687306 RepID=A0ABS5F505_9PROT|nr:transcriptional regulator [Plastoroseomonas hellenica]